MIAGVLAAAIVGLVIRFIGTLISEIVVHWLIYSEGTSQSTLTAFAVVTNVVEEVLFVAIAVACLVPGLVRSGMVAGREVRAGLLAGVIPGAIRVVSAGLSCVTLLIFGTETSGAKLDITFTAFSFMMYGVIGVFVGLIIGAAVAAVVKPKRAA